MRSCETKILIANKEVIDNIKRHFSHHITSTRLTRLKGIFLIKEASTRQVLILVDQSPVECVEGRGFPYLGNKTVFTLLVQSEKARSVLQTGIDFCGGFLAGKPHLLLTEFCKFNLK